MAAYATLARLADTANPFVPFYTAEPQGAGSGLFISRQIAEGHGGTLRLENRGEGSGVRARMVFTRERPVS